ncbi:cysteine-rich receptor-like protein kinase 25 isoform X1 [Cajanus cajan]|uniref:cysteine-rich receptor-like protein kinase 25 isoform X1 n=1 Tax=Cajanus cajan TaxID=3821 RepID=UPI0010FB2BB3|nr:cysteine-rich receptor-like protein kinase 25 isoform X1 [Cajanus cajan]
MAAMPTVSKSFLLFVILILMIMSLATAQPSFVKYYCDDNNGNYTANSTFQANLNTLLSKLTSNTETNTNYGFYNFSKGQNQNSDKVNVIGMCRGDVNTEACTSCLNDSVVLLTRLCPNQKEAIAWYDSCMLRYSNRSIFGIMEFEPSYLISNNKYATSVDRYNEVVEDLLRSLASKAASGDSHLKFAEASQKGPSFQTVFAHVQCTPDLSNLQCNQCLFRAMSYIPKCCSGKVRGRIFKPSCNLRFDTTPYLDPTYVPPSLTPQSLPSPSPSIHATFRKGKSNSWRTVIAIIAAIVSVMILVTFTCIYLRRRKPRMYFESESEADYDIEPTQTLQFDFQAIIDATNNFADANKLGQGGFGPVYKGTLPSGKEVAIKRLSRGSGQGDIEFKNELLLLAKLQHRNLVRLLGFCLETGERILVYEFLPNKSLDYFIFDPIKRLSLDWDRRYKIIQGIARGLVYLHEDSRLRIIHRDLKTSNILLDEEMNPKISDFGMAKLFATDQTLGNTLRVVGTYGYMAPEYAMHGYFSVRSDVFSFGVLILEIVTGHKNSDIRHPDSGYVEHLISFVRLQFVSQITIFLALK